MKVLLGVIALLSCVLTAYILSGKYSDRRKFYADFYNFNLRLKTEISFKQASLIKILSEFEESNSTFITCLKNYFNGQGFNIKNKFLNAEEKEYVEKYVKSIGLSDKHTQLEFIAEVDEFIGKKTNVTQEEEKKYKSLYLKLGFFAGLIAFIILL